MSTILNERDLQLQATTPRLLAISTNYISMAPSTNTFTTTSAGIVPTSISIKAFKNGILSGDIVWSSIPSIPYSSIPDGISIAGIDIPIGTSVTFTASLTYLGNIYSASTVITRAANSSIITLEQTAANINKSSIGSFSPTTVTFSGKVVDGSNPPTTYAGRFIVDSTNDGTIYSNLYTSSVDEVIYTYTPNINHKAVRVKFYAAGGVITLLDQKSTSISESGATGSDGNIIYITPSSYVLAKNQNNVFSPLSIIFYAKSKTGTLAATTYLGRFKIYENGSGIASYSSLSDESSTNYIPTIACSSLKCELYTAGGFITKIDEQGITISLSGSNAISTVLTNEAHVLPSDSSGNITSYAGSGTQLYVYEGGVEIPYDEAGYTAGNNNTWKVTTISSNITVGSKTDGGTYADFAPASSVASGIDTSTITFTITGRTSIGVTFTNTKVQKFAKSKQGLQGPAGPTDTSNLLVLNASNILTGTVVPIDSGGFKTGTITWNSTSGALTAGTGIAITEWGIIGATSGVPTFTIQASTGAATFLGDITGGSNININGQGVFNGQYTVSGKNAAIHANTSNAAVIGISTSSTASGGYALQAACSGSATGGALLQATGAGKRALEVNGISSALGIYATGICEFYNSVNFYGGITTSSTSLVTNLNADMVDGRQASNLCSIVATDSNDATVGGNGFQLKCTVSGVRTRANVGTNYTVIESFSDARMKNNIVPEEYGIDFINKLLPCTFGVNHLPGLRYHGFIHQDVRTLVPEDDALAAVNSDGTGTFDYNGITAPIIKALQELHQEVVQLRKRVKILEKNNG